MTPARRFQAALAAAILGIAGVQTALAAGGTEVDCRREGTVRRIEVLRDPAPPRRCEMRYGTSGLGEATRVVWFSERDRSFCHERADMLIARLARRGWVCDVMPKRNVAVDSDREADARTGMRAGSVLTVPRPR